MLGRHPQVDFIELHILHHAETGEVYGLWMIEELAEHGYKVNASQLYPKFHRLEREGFLARNGRVIDGKVRKYYRATAAGQEYLRDQKAKLMELAGEALTADEIRALLEARLARDRQLRRRK